MAEFIYKSTIDGINIFTVPDEGGIVELNSRKLNTFGGYLTPVNISPSRRRHFTGNYGTHVVEKTNRVPIRSWAQSQWCRTIDGTVSLLKC